MERAQGMEEGSMHRRSGQDMEAAPGMTEHPGTKEPFAMEDGAMW
jgi:hypothetical protein